MKFEVDLMPGTVSWLETQPSGTVQAALAEWRFKQVACLGCNNWLFAPNYCTTCKEVEDESITRT